MDLRTTEVLDLEVLDLDDYRIRLIFLMFFSHYLWVPPCFGGMALLRVNYGKKYSADIKPYRDIMAEVATS